MNYTTHIPTTTYRHWRFSSLAIAAIALATAMTVSARQDSAAGTYDLSWHTIDGGGGISAAGALELNGTIGQPDAGSAMTGCGFQLVGGFWTGAAGPQVDTCPPDIAPPGGGDGAVNVADLLAVISSWGACPAPPADCEADIAPPGGGDGTVNVADLLAVISGWGACPP